MNTAVVLSRSLMLIGLAGMLVGAIDPLEGSLIILPAAVIANAGGFIGKSAYRSLLFGSLLLIALGVAAMFVLSSYGGVGGSSGHSVWWLVLLLPYPIGWFLAVSSAILSLFDRRKSELRPHAGN